MCTFILINFLAMFAYIKVDKFPCIYNMYVKWMEKAKKYRIHALKLKGSYCFYDFKPWYTGKNQVYFGSEQIF